jgi:hypothetical protein
MMRPCARRRKKHRKKYYPLAKYTANGIMIVEVKEEQTPNRKEATMTKPEWAIIEHRLGAPDAIADALSDDPGYHAEDVHDVCHELMQGRWQEANAINDRIVAAVLVDCIDGSTYLADSARRAAKKVSDYLGVDLYIPEA